MSEKNIFQRMAEASAKIGTVAKGLTVEAGRGSYKAVSEADVLAAVKPIEQECGIFSYPCKRQVIESGELVSETSKGQRRQLYLRVETVYRFVNLDDPADFLEVTTYGDGVDSADKAPGKAMTYADKYALLKAYKVVTGDDPDQEASQPLVSKVTQVPGHITPAQQHVLLAKLEELGLDERAVFPQGVAGIPEHRFEEAVQHLAAKVAR